MDDERLARQELRRLLAEHVDVEVAGEGRNADEAEDLLKRFEPDLLFLDIQMPSRSGLEMLEQIANPPQTILTMAFDQYALRGFELNAVDYLLKPISPERLADALRRVRERIQARPAELKKGQETAPLEQVFVRDAERCWRVQMAEIALLQSKGNYARVVFGSNQPLIPRSLAQIEARIDARVFFRANRGEPSNQVEENGLALDWSQSGYVECRFSSFRAQRGRRPNPGRSPACSQSCARVQRN